MSLPAVPSIVHTLVGAATTPLRDPAAAVAVALGAVVVIVDRLLITPYGVTAGAACQPSARFLPQLSVEMEAVFADAVRDLVSGLATGLDPGPQVGGGMARVFRETGAATPRGAVEALVDRWFRPVPPHLLSDDREPLLNRPDIGESEKIHATLREHVVGQRRWQELSSNESTFYRYRRAAISAFSERLWSEVAERRLPSNRPPPEYVHLIGRGHEVATLLRWLGEPGGTLVGVEGPGGSGKTALLHGVADACVAAARSWRPLSATPVFDALVWTA